MTQDVRIALIVDTDHGAALGIEDTELGLCTAVGAYIYEDVPTYQGEYTVTPTQETQVLEMAGLKALENVTVNPIPSNYGLITWDGSVLTVS